jgi:hypothetical protein
MQKVRKNTLHGGKESEMNTQLELIWHVNCTNSTLFCICTNVLYNKSSSKKTPFSLSFFFLLFFFFPFPHITSNTASLRSYMYTRAVPKARLYFPQTQVSNRELRSWTTYKQQKGITGQQFYCLKRNTHAGAMHSIITHGKKKGT